MKLFLDSGAFIARALAQDQYHAAAVDTFRKLSTGDLPYRLHYTSNYVVDETVTFLLYQRGPRPAIETLQRIRSSPTLRVLHVSEEVESEADEVFRRHASSRVSYTDCTTRVLMMRESIDTAFSFDRDLEVLGVQRIP
jgi:predicted nucleic acid-binding protein